MDSKKGELIGFENKMGSQMKDVERDEEEFINKCKVIVR